MTYNRGDIVTVNAIGFKEGALFLVVEDWSKEEPKQVLVTGTSGNGNDGKCLVVSYYDVVMVRPFVAGE